MFLPFSFQRNKSFSKDQRTKELMIKKRIDQLVKKDKNIKIF